MTHTDPRTQDAPPDATPLAPGERTLEVVALYGGTPQRVSHLSKPSAGRVRLLSAALLAAGLVLTVGGATAFVSQLWSVHQQTIHRAKVIEFIKERGLPEKFAPAVRSHPAAEVGGAAAFAVGLFLLMFGGFRMLEERRPARFRIGEDPRADYPTPSAGLPSPCFELVSADGHRYQVHFTPAMEGEAVYPDGTVVALPDLARQGLAAPDHATASFSWTIPDGARCRLQLGASTFQLRAVPRGEGVAQEGLRQRAVATLTSPLAMSTFGSASVLGAFLLLMQLRPGGSDSLEADSLSEARRKMVRELRTSATKDRAKPPVKKTPKPPKVVNRTKQPVDRKAPKITATVTDERLRTRTPSASSAAPGNNPSRAQGRSAGMLAVLGSQSKALSNMFSRDSSVSKDVEDSLAAITGYTYGSGDPLAGLGDGGRAGSPNGAGGISLGGGFWSKDKGGGGGFPNGGGIQGGVPIGPGVPNRNVGQPKVFFPSRADVLEGIDSDTIKRVIRRYLAQIRFCYQTRGLPSNPRLAGEVKVAFMINAHGKVIKATIASSTLGNAPTEQCIVSHLYGWRFPKTGGRTAYVKYPFRFRPAGAR